MFQHVEQVGVVVVSRSFDVVWANAVACGALLRDDGELLDELRRVARASRRKGRDGVGAPVALRAGGTTWDVRTRRLERPAGALLLIARAVGVRAGAVGQSFAHDGSRLGKQLPLEHRPTR